MAKGEMENLAAAAAGLKSVTESLGRWVTSGQALKDLFVPGALLALLGEDQKRTMMLGIIRGVFYPSVVTIGSILLGNETRHVINENIGVLPIACAFMGLAGEEIIGTGIAFGLIDRGKNREEIK